MRSKCMDELTLCWSITTKCNMNCWYCFSRYDSKNIQYDMSDIIRDYTLERLKKLSKNISIRTVILGGEPSLYYDLYNLTKNLLTFSRKVIVVTNGTKKEVINELPSDVSIDLSYHGQDIETFLSVLHEIKKYHYTQVLCTLDTKCIDRCIEIYNKCCDEDIYCEIIPIVDNETEQTIVYDKNIMSKFNRKQILYKNEDLFGIKNNIGIYFQNLYYNSNDKFIVCKQTNLALYPDGTIYPCCKTGQREHKKYVYDDNAFRYILTCKNQYCMMNRGCLDMAGWRQDPDGRFFSGNNE